MDFNRAFQQYDTLDGANCLTVGKRHLSQREAALEAVGKVGLSMVGDVSGVQVKMLRTRLNVLKAEKVVE